jgi:hypothetical protein
MGFVGCCSEGRNWAGTGNAGVHWSTRRSGDGPQLCDALIGWVTVNHASKVKKDLTTSGRRILPGGAEVRWRFVKDDITVMC